MISRPIPAEREFIVKSRALRGRWKEGVKKALAKFSKILMSMH